MAFQNSGNSGGYSQEVLGIEGIEVMVIDVNLRTSLCDVLTMGIRELCILNQRKVAGLISGNN